MTDTMQSKFWEYTWWFCDDWFHCVCPHVNK